MTMKLSVEAKQAWKGLATRLRAMEPTQFYSNFKYDPIRSELCKLVWSVRLGDNDLLMRVYKSSPQQRATIEWAQGVSVEETLAMLQTLMSQERWVDGIAAEPHKNGFLSFALERVAESDGDFVPAP